jgi:type II secretory pathway pseudopilin PulG
MRAYAQPQARRRARQRAFTLTEIMVTMGILMMVMAAVIYGHIAGLKMYGYTKAKLGASEMARSAINNLVAEIRTCKRVQVGNGDLTSFAFVADGQEQKGTAVQIYPTLDTNVWIRYYLDNSAKLLRTTNGTSVREIVAEFITNKVVFAAEDATGAVLTNNVNNRVVSMTLQFYQIQYPITPVGTPGAYFDFYQLRTKVTRRALE